jgi:hypothetical protein
LEVDGVAVGSAGGSVVDFERRERLEALLCRERFLAIFIMAESLRGWEFTS